MSFDWQAIESYEDPEVGLYRLIGEMLQRHATLDDLERIETFLLTRGPTSDAWRSIGEALHRTTSGSPAGFDIWETWSESLDEAEYPSERLAQEWIAFGEEMSEANDDFDPSIDVVPGREPTDVDEEVADELADDDASTDVLSGPAPPPPFTGVLGESPTQLLRMVPTGPYTIRLFGTQYEGVDEYTILALIKRGLFLAAHVRFGDGWLSAWEHPAFSQIAARLQGEARRILSRAEIITEEATRPQ